VPIEQFTQAASFATEGRSAARQIAPYAGAGMTWWIEALGWWRGGQPAAAAASPTANRFDQPAKPNGNRPDNPIHRY
jgi:hypothetical protein